MRRTDNLMHVEGQCRTSFVSQEYVVYVDYSYLSGASNPGVQVEGLIFVIAEDRPPLQVYSDSRRPVSI